MKGKELVTLPEPVARRGLTEEQWRTLKGSVFPGARNESILLAVDYCRARGLDPLKKPVHIVPMQVHDAKTGRKEWRDVVMTGIAELRTTAARSGRYCGQDLALYGEEQEHLGIKAPEWAEITVYRLVNGQRCAFTHREYFAEAVQCKKDRSPNAMWSKRPRGQLAKCAEAGALRKAFPEELGGEQVHESAPVAEEIDDAETFKAVPAVKLSRIESVKAALDESGAQPDQLEINDQENLDDSEAGGI